MSAHIHHLARPCIHGEEDHAALRVEQLHAVLPMGGIGARPDQPGIEDPAREPPVYTDEYIAEGPDVTGPHGIARAVMIGSHGRRGRKSEENRQDRYQEQCAHEANLRPSI